MYVLVTLAALCFDKRSLSVCWPPCISCVCLFFVQLAVSCHYVVCCVLCVCASRRLFATRFHRPSTTWHAFLRVRLRWWLHHFLFPVFPTLRLLPVTVVTLPVMALLRLRRAWPFSGKHTIWVRLWRGRREWVRDRDKRLWLANETTAFYLLIFSSQLNPAKISQVFPPDFLAALRRFTSAPAGNEKLCEAPPSWISFQDSTVSLSLAAQSYTVFDSCCVLPIG